MGLIFSLHADHEILFLLNFTKWMLSFSFLKHNGKMYIEMVSSSDCRANVATAQGSIPASSNAKESKDKQIKQCLINYEECDTKDLKTNIKSL